MRRALAAAAATVAALALAGCADGDDPPASSQEAPGTSANESPGDSPSASADPATDEGTVIEIRIQGDSVEPQGESVEVEAGKPVTLKVTSDRAAELHVHSSPEQELEVDKGESTLPLTLSTPGVVDVEEHESGVVVVRLEVR